MKPEILSVRLFGLPIGNLHKTTEGEMRFDYLEKAAKPLSLSMPLHQTSYGNLACETYFGGLLPESPDARRAIGREFNVNPNSTFSLLSAIGHDCAGAVSLYAPGKPVLVDGDKKTQTKAISEKELEKRIIQLPQKPLFTGVKEVRLSLAGMQEKAAVCLVDNKVCLALDYTPTTHILKPAIKKYPATVQNEFLCMKTAKQLGLPAAKVEIRKAGSEIYLLVERYDRSIDKENKIRRLHQEDFCQALGNREKYERYYGPGLTDCFELTFDFSIPVISRNLLMDIVVFNVLIGNNDAHGKNFGVLYDESWKIKLAPFYDLLCTQVYSARIANAPEYTELTNDMSMKIGQSYLHDAITASDWEKLCADVQFSFPALKKVIAKQASLVATTFAEQRAQLKGSPFDSPILDEIVDRVKKNCKKLKRMF